jgi:uncharacterized protein YuzE
MRLSYDPDKDVLTIAVGRSPVARRENGGHGLSLGLGAGGEIVDIELSPASRLVDEPRTLDVDVAGRTVRGLRML